MSQDSREHSLDIMLAKAEVGMTDSRRYNLNQYLGGTNVVIDFYVAIDEVTAGTFDDKGFRSHRDKGLR